MRDRLLPQRYARALLGALPDAQAAENASLLLDTLARAMEASRELRDLLLNPAVTRRDRKKVLQALADPHQPLKEVRSFLAILADHNRAGILPDVAAEFRIAREDLAGIVRAQLSSAVPLPPDQRDRARTALEHVSGRRVTLTCEVDPTLIGGAVARIGSMVYDGSLRTKLGGLKRKMIEE
jgi:F-type H+-transporting ATPase subunit delta